MSLFVDRLMLQFSDPAQLMQLLVPASDANHTRLLQLVEAAYDFPTAILHDARDVTINRTEFQRALFPARNRRGTWTQTTPSYARTDVAYEYLNWQEPLWLDISVEVGLTLVLEVDPGSVESILSQEIADFNTIDEFRARFQFIDMNAFMDELGITTLEQLKERYRYLLAEFRMRAPPAFDPNSPANQHHFTLNLAILIRDSVDIASALRDAKLARASFKRALAYKTEVDVAEVLTPYAPVIVFQESALAGTPFSADALQKFFAAEHILALAVTPS